MISVYDFVLQLGIILLSTKLLGILMRKLGLPQVLGFILAGILVGRSVWGLIFNISSSAVLPIAGTNNPYLDGFAEVGVILVLFSAGLETDLKELKSSGFVAFLIALGGVLVPLGAGFGIGCAFLGTKNLISCLFVGVIMTATSVGITVETLKEMNKLKTKVGTVILSAAIIDDVLGIIVLSIALSLKRGAGSTGASSSWLLDLINPNGTAWISILWMFVYFIVAVAVGIVVSKLFHRLEEKHPNTRRLPVLSLAVCFIYAYVAEAMFGVADITGAYIAGIILSTNHKSAEYTDRKITISSYMIFAPIFFANIGISISFSSFTLDVLWFALAFVAVAILGKIIGCGLVAKLCKFGNKDCLKIGVGMIARGEVALVVTQKGINGGLLDAKNLAVTIMLVLVSSILAPILLKLLFKDHGETPNNLIKIKEGPVTLEGQDKR